MKHFRYLLSILLLCLVTVVAGAANNQKKKSRTFTGHYKERPIKEVLKDLKSDCGISVSTQKGAVNRNRKVTVHFVAATPDEVLHELFDCAYVITQGQGKRKNSYQVNALDVTPHSEVVQTYVRDTTLHSTDVVSRVEVDSLHATIVTRRQTSLVTLEDSIRTTQNRIDRRDEEGKEVKTGTDAYHHSLQAYLGGAYSSLGYRLQEGKNLGGIGGEVSLRYAYFFTPEWGLGVGVDYDTYHSVGQFDGIHRWDGQRDSEGEQYNHLALTHKWREQQRIHEVSIPIVAEYQHRWDNNYGIFCALGAYVGMPLAAGWSLKRGALEHQGEYPQWGLTLDGITGHDFYTETIGQDFSTERHKLELKKLTAGVKADVGALIPLTDQMDLFAGVYAKVDALDIQGERHGDLGWQQAEATPAYRKHNFMPEYAGMLNTNMTAAVRPYEVGLKVGIHFRPTVTKSVKKTICNVLVDTTYSSSFRYDTIHTDIPDTIVSLRRTLHKAVIWFAVNDYEHPRVQPEDLLERVAEILIAQPEQRIAINGHASSEGNARINQQLSDRRAETVARMLIQLGVPAEQIVTKGFSSEIDYQRDEDTDTTIIEGRTAAELNRRVEIIPLND